VQNESVLGLSDWTNILASGDWLIPPLVSFLGRFGVGEAGLIQCWLRGGLWPGKVYLQIFG